MPFSASQPQEVLNWEAATLFAMDILHGKLVSGRGDFGHWIERLNDLYEQKTGMRLYPGTLNVELLSKCEHDDLRLAVEPPGPRISDQDSRLAMTRNRPNSTKRSFRGITKGIWGSAQM